MAMPAQCASCRIITYINRDVDADAVVRLPHVRLVAPFLSSIMPYDQCISRQLFEETFRVRTIDEKVEGLRNRQRREEREEDLHLVL